MASKKKEIPQLKYFISSVDTLLGQAIVEQVRNDQTNTVNPHIILGTKSPNGVGKVSSAVKKVIHNSDVNILTNTLLNSDVIIYDLNTANHDEIEYAIKVLKMSNFEGEKFLILVSSVMVWSDTPPKEKKEGDEDDEEVGEPEEGEEEEEEPEAPPADGEDEEPKKVFISYKEKDYTMRKPLPKYEIFKSIETLCLSAGNSKKNLLTYVLCPGILYGNGEEVFANYFKQAWLQDPQALSYIGDGKNSIPTIHVRDLAMYVHFVVNKKPQTRYIFAIDQTRKPTLKKHVETISKGLGTGKVQSIPVEAAGEDPYLEIFKLNIKLIPSKIVEQVEAEEENQEEEQPEEEEEEGEEGVEKVVIPKFKFTWWCKEGMKKHIAKIVGEYNTYRGLKPIKIFITGPPASGKTFFSHKFSKHYNIPHILIKDVVNEVKELQNDFGEEIRTALEEIRDKMIEEAEAALEEQKEKKTKKKNEPVINTDPEKMIPRLPDELLCKAYKYRLEKNDCFNRGFVIDGFPRTYDQAKGVFLMIDPTKEEEADPDNPPMIIDTRKIPEFVIQLQASEAFLDARAKGLSEEETEGTHYTEEGMKRRQAIYKKDNVSEGGNSVLSTFFDENKIEILKIQCEAMSNENIFNAIKIFVERKEKFKNYQNFEDVEEIQRKKHLKNEQEKTAQRIEMIKKEQEEKENEERQLQEERARITLEGVKEKEKKLLDQRSAPLRHYLGDQVVPILTSGIIQICKERPEDPVDFLAQYLFKRSLDVKFPDPGAVDKQ